MPAALILEQAKAALWLLCHHGGVGSKSRKGFGSFRDPADLAGHSLPAILEHAAEFRKVCGLPQGPFDANKAQSPTWSQQLPCADIMTEWKNCWWALDQVGDVVQRFAQQLKHDRSKKGLGLPRNVKPPLKGTFPAGGPAEKTGRHAAPVWFHMGMDEQSKNLIVRVTAFPARHLPDLQSSTTLLTRLVAHIRAELPNRIQVHRNKGPFPPSYPPAPVGSTTALSPVGTPITALPKPGASVLVTIVPDPRNRGRLFAQLKAGALVGTVLNPNDVPEASKLIGTEITLEVASISTDGKQIAYRWPR